jgi:hypothetical protein
MKVCSQEAEEIALLFLLRSYGIDKMQVGSSWELQSLYHSSDRLHRRKQSKKTAREKKVDLTNQSVFPPLLMHLRETYLATVEERLQRMERAMAKSARSGDITRRTTDEIDHQGGINDKLSMLKISIKGSTAFIGRGIDYFKVDATLT